jgi:predicted metal-dependent hydrolase
MTARTPEDLSIQRRDYRFERATPHPRWWHSGDPVATAYFNALSASFPLGERFFIDSVKAFRDKTDGKLREQVADFIFQESIHSREHVAFNQAAADAGYDMDSLEARTAAQIAHGRRGPPIDQLAITAAMEHFTAIMAAEVLSNPRHLQGMPEEIAEMWRWHAMEELEHKAVAFDVYRAATKHWPAPVRWLRRSFVMAVSTWFFFAELHGNMRDLFQQDGIDNRATWKQVRRYLLVEPGMMGAVLKSYFRYYKPGFHPWAADDRALLETAKRVVSPPKPALA